MKQQCNTVLPPRHKKNAYNGWLVIDKPLGCSSTDVGRIIKRTLHPLKIGHVGTLDPLASGVLVMALGEATKLIPYWTKDTKTYTFDVTFGESRVTDDAEGDILECSNIIPTKSQIDSVLDTFIGCIDQIPPNYSAIQVAGQRSYKRARSGEVFTLPSRQVHIYKLNCKGSSYENDAPPHTFSFEVTCKTGTYVRSLARDIAHSLGTVGYVSRLRRITDGVFTEKHTITLENLAKISHYEESLFPLSFVLDDILAVTVGEEDKKRLYNGQPIVYPCQADGFEAIANSGTSCEGALCLSENDEHTVQIHYNGHLIAMGSIEGPLIKPKRILHLGEYDVDNY